MRKLLNILLSRRGNENYRTAISKIEEIKSKLELHPKQIKYKEIFITEINF